MEQGGAESAPYCGKMHFEHRTGAGTMFPEKKVFLRLIRSNISAPDQ
jgi:hypothetical protein